MSQQLHPTPRSMPVQPPRDTMSPEMKVGAALPPLGCSLARPCRLRIHVPLPLRQLPARWRAEPLLQSAWPARCTC